MPTIFKFGILLAVFRIECFELLVKQIPNPANEHDNVTLRARYSGFQETEYPSFLEWYISSLRRFERIRLPECTVFGFIDKNAYSFSCSEGELTWTILNVSRSQHDQIWSCTLTTSFRSIDVELALKLQVEVSAVQLTKPTETEVIETEYSRVLFECVSEGLPAPTIRWFMDNKTPNNSDDDVEQNSTNINNVTEQNADNTYHVKSQLHLTIDRKFDGLNVYCTANNTAQVFISSRRPVIRVQYSKLFIENPLNCSEPASLRCASSIGTSSTWNFKLNGKTLVSSNNIDSSTTYKSSIDNDGTITLLVLNTSVYDQGSYTCQISSYPESQPVKLEFECRPKSVKINTRDDATIQFVFDNVYPTPTEVFVTVFSQEYEEFTCGGVSCKPNDKGYYNCIWNSNRSFKKGTYTYVFDIKFITKKDCFVGNFTIDVYSTSESITLEKTNRSHYNGPDLNLTCIYTGNRTVKTVSWYRNHTLVGAVSPSCEILTRPHFGRYQFVCPSPFETVLSVDQLIVNRTLDRWTCRVGFGFGNVLESRPFDLLFEGLATEGSDQPGINSEMGKVVGGVIGGFVSGLLVGIASIFLSINIRLRRKRNIESDKETKDIPMNVAAAHHQKDIELNATRTLTLEVENYGNDVYENSDSLEQPKPKSLPYENVQEQDTKTNTNEGVEFYQNTKGTPRSHQIAGEIRSYERLQDDLRGNQEQYDVILQY
ncbi:uncharacterized protein LOC128234018 [Mya arenaria]|uniref:uncharacterized protein LOC128234018 n=1 Tax=Mya arenaria TaxID=6604 RepID=UPI0022E8F2B2|nr:uncharacterized protein LOC128234018 [Mya arenaria]